MARPELPHVEPLRVVAAASVEVDVERPGWLVEELWSAEGVGIIGGAPKCCKTWLALDLAVSVASGSDVLGRFRVATPGPVLLYGAEDSPVRLRDRIETIAAARGVAFERLDVGLIVADSLRLDAERDRARLRATLVERRPRLLVLDPLVRLHRIDENSAGEMSALLGELRRLQREHQLAIVLVHHLRKYAPGGQDGQALRGSGDLHAWGDSNLYLRRRERQIQLTIEHRSAPSPQPQTLELADDPPHLRVVAQKGDEPGAVADIAERIVAALGAAGRPMTRDGLRAALQARNATIGDALVKLRHAGHIERCAGGFRARPRPDDNHSVPALVQERERNGPGPPSSP